MHAYKMTSMTTVFPQHVEVLVFCQRTMITVCTILLRIPDGIVLRCGGRRQSTCQPSLHMSQRSIFSLSKCLCNIVTEEHFFFVKGALP